jgi:hypothetical protein
MPDNNIPDNKDKRKPIYEPRDGFFRLSAEGEVFRKEHSIPEALMPNIIIEGTPSHYFFKNENINKCIGDKTLEKQVRDLILDPNSKITFFEGKRKEYEVESLYAQTINQNTNYIKDEYFNALYEHYKNFSQLSNKFDAQQRAESDISDFLSEIYKLSGKNLNISKKELEEVIASKFDYFKDDNKDISLRLRDNNFEVIDGNNIGDFLKDIEISLKEKSKTAKPLTKNQDEEFKKLFEKYKGTEIGNFLEKISSNGPVKGAEANKITQEFEKLLEKHNKIRLSEETDLRSLFAHAASGKKLSSINLDEKMIEAIQGLVESGIKINDKKSSTYEFSSEKLQKNDPERIV